MKKHEETKTITITKPTGNVEVTTTVGNGNLGGGNVKDAAGNRIAKGLLKKFVLGNGQSLAGKTFVVTTNALDINSITNQVPVTHQLTGGGITPVTFDFLLEADNDGVVSFVITYIFQ